LLRQGNGRAATEAPSLFRLRTLEVMAERALAFKQIGDLSAKGCTGAAFSVVENPLRPLAAITSSA
jgi:hypothetical protein